MANPVGRELLTAARVGHDGMPAFRRLRGRSWEPSLAVFGEQVLARRPRALEQGDMEPRWDQVTYLGSRWGTAEHWVADEAGTARLVRAIRRKPMQERWSAERLARITGLPDEPLRSEGGPAVAPAPPLEVVPHPDQDVPAPRVTRGSTSARRTFASMASHVCARSATRFGQGGK